MKLADFADSTELEEELARRTEDLAAAKRSLGQARTRERSAVARVTDLEAMLTEIAQISALDLAPVPWAKPAKGDKVHHGTAVLMLSDLHLDEKVSVFELDGLNSYDRRIAEMRLDQVANGVVKLLRDYTAGIVLDGIVVPLIGDIITGVIHDELARTNEAPVPATIAYWVPRLAGLLQYLADELGVPVHVPTVDGNHDRTYAKTPSKQRTESSNAWIIYKWLADTLRDDDRVTFDISVSPHSRFDIYGTRFLLAHGDAFRSAGGVGGLYPSLLKWVLRMHALYSTGRNDFDHVLIGHWHQLLWGTDFIVNGSLKGYDEYARHGGFGFERPQQALFIVTPEHGITQRIPVFADSPVAEGWRKKKAARHAR